MDAIDIVDTAGTGAHPVAAGSRESAAPFGAAPGRGAFDTRSKPGSNGSFCCARRAIRATVAQTIPGRQA